MVGYTSTCVRILEIRRANGVCVSDQHQRVRVTEGTGRRSVGMRPVEFHSRCRERRSSSHRAVLSHTSRVTGCHEQESLSPRFWLSGRVIVRVTSRRRGEEGRIHTSSSISRCEAGCTRLFRCFSLLREDEKQREREGGGRDRLFRLPTARTLSSLTN